MILKRALLGAVLLAGWIALPACFAQREAPTRPSTQTPRTTDNLALPGRGLTTPPATGVPNANAAPAAGTQATATGTLPESGAPAGNGAATGASDMEPAHISIATPAPAPSPWTWQERVTWGANILLVVFAYVGIMMGLSLLRKIERQTQYSEDAAEAAKTTAQAALTQLDSLLRGERPWVLMSVRPSQNIENGFAVVATNRGRSPARILSLVDEVVSAVDEAHLPEHPVYKNESKAPAEPTILLPGESSEIASFSRADVRRICESDERLARVEKWEERIYLYGNVTYCDLSAPQDAPAHESAWFCWYIHGRQKSGMVMAGPPAYNRHS